MLPHPPDCKLGRGENAAPRGCRRGGGRRHRRARAPPSATVRRIGLTVERPVC